MKKVLVAVFLSVLLSSCANTYNTLRYEDFAKEGMAQGYPFCAKAQKPSWVTTDGLGELDSRICWNTQERANTRVLNDCGSDCVITMKGFKITPEGERLIKEAKLAEQKKVSDKKVELLTMINEAKSTCKELGFKENTDKFSDCALKLYTQKIDQTIKQKETVIVQTQASSGSMTIYDPVRDNQRMIDQGMKMLSGRCTLGIDC